MIRQILKRVAIRKKDYALPTKGVRASSSNNRKINLEVKINQQNETFEFELHDAEVSAASGKQKRLEFPFVYLRDNCQVSFVILYFKRS